MRNRIQKGTVYNLEIHYYGTDLGEWDVDTVCETYLDALMRADDMHDNYGYVLLDESRRAERTDTAMQIREVKIYGYKEEEY